MATIIPPFPQIPHTCTYCTITCTKKSDWIRHINTIKHKVNENTINCNNLSTSAAQIYTCICGKKYSDRSGLWKHKKKCILKNEDTEEILEEPKINNLIIEILKSNNEIVKSNSELQKQNQEFKNLIIEVCKNNQITNNTLINNNSHNKTFNLQFFLNEECKDAMNIMEFVDSIKLDLDDLINVGKVGYINGISNIIIQNLKALDIYKRPVHCTDLKRETIYIKNNNVWEKETENNDLTRKSIKHIAKKNCTVLFLFKEKYPDCIYAASKYSDWYTKLTSEAFGGVEPEIKISENKIIKKILKEITLDKIKNNN